MAVDIALHGAVDDDLLRLHTPLDAALFADPERGLGAARGRMHTADDAAVDMQPAGEREVALQHGLWADQGVDASGHGRFASREHVAIPSIELRSIRRPPTAGYA